MKDEVSTDISVSARKIVPPTTISDAARATLVNGSPLGDVIFSEPEPHPDDKEAWQRYIEEREELRGFTRRHLGLYQKGE